MNDALNVPDVFFTLIRSGKLSDEFSMLFASCSESVSRFHSLKRHITVAVSPSLSFSPHPSRIICMYTPVVSKSTYCFSTRRWLSPVRGTPSRLSPLCFLSRYSFLLQSALSSSGQRTIRCRRTTSM